MIAWMLPLLVIISFLSGFVCNRFHLSTRMILLPLLFLTFILYQATLRISLWKSVSIYLAVCAVFSCFNSLARATSAMLSFNSEEQAFSGFSVFAVLYNIFCILLLYWSGIRLLTLSRTWSRMKILPRHGMYSGYFRFLSSDWTLFSFQNIIRFCTHSVSCADTLWLFTPFFLFSHCFTQCFWWWLTFWIKTKNCSRKICFFLYSRNDMRI